MKRKLITLFLIAVSGVLLYGNYSLITGYYDASYYNVDITSDTDEVIFDAGSANATVNINIKNNSRKILSSQNNVFLSYHLLDKDGGLVDFDGPRTDFSTFKPYHSGSVMLEIVRPAQPGEYIIEVDLVEEGVSWFQNRGNKTLLIRLTV